MTWIGAVALAVTVLALPAVFAQDEPQGFSQVVPSDIKWTPHPAVSGAQIAVLVGDPAKAGPFVIRVRLPPGLRIMPHTHCISMRRVKSKR